MGTHFAGTEEEILALECYIKLSRAAESVATRINDHLRSYHLTISQFGVLEALYHLGPMQSNQLADKILKSSGNLTMVIDNLEKRGFVQRSRREDDRRCVDIVLTENGRSLIESIFPQHVTGVVAAFSTLSAAEQTELATLCRKLGLAQS